MASRECAKINSGLIQSPIRKKATKNYIFHVAANNNGNSCLKFKQKKGIHFHQNA